MTSQSVKHTQKKKLFWHDVQNLNTGCDKTSLRAVTFESNSRDNWLRGWNKTSLKAVARWAGDKKKKNMNQDVRDCTMREPWHKLWGKWGLPDERQNTCTGTATDTHRQIRGPLPKLKMNSVTSLSHSGFSSLPTSPLLSSSAQSEAGPEPFRSAGQYFILLPAPLAHSPTLPSPARPSPF